MHKLSHTFSILPHIHLTNDFLVNKEILNHLPLPLLYVAPSRQILWRNRYAGWFHAGRKSVRALLRQVVQKEEHQRIAPVVLSSGVQVAVESQPVRNLAGNVEGYLLWVSDNLSGMVGDFLQVGVAIAQDGHFILGNYTARVLLDEDIVGRSWNSVEWLPPWHVVLRRGHQVFFTLTQSQYEIRIHTHYPWAIIEAIPQRLVEDQRIGVQFASAMMHEVRNPLTALSGYVELALMQSSDEDAKKQLTQAMVEIDRLSRLTSDLMWLSESREIRKEWCDVQPLVEKAWSVIQTGMPQKLAIDMTLHDDWIYVDPDRFAQIFINLFKNSAEATPNGVKVKVWVRQDEKAHYVFIEDDGPGIPDEVLRTLFVERRTTKSQGHGLGLLIVKQLVDAHGARLEISSSPHKGTFVSIALPYPDSD